MYGYTETVIGRVTIDETIRVTQTYETAAWYTIIDLEPGTYDVVEYYSRQDGHRSWVARVPGRIVKNWAPSLLGGVRISGGRTGEEENGRMTEYRIGFTKDWNAREPMDSVVVEGKRLILERR